MVGVGVREAINVLMPKCTQGLPPHWAESRERGGGVGCGQRTCVSIPALGPANIKRGRVPYPPSSGVGNLPKATRVCARLLSAALPQTSGHSTRPDANTSNSAHPSVSVCKSKSSLFPLSKFPPAPQVWVEIHLRQ